MQMDCNAVHDDIDAYAIGALDADEAQALAAHLPDCPACAHLVEEARGDATTALALTAPFAASSPALKARVMASAAVLTDIGRPRRRSARWWQAAAAVLVAGFGAAFVWGFVMQRRVDTLEQHNASLRTDATAQSAELATVRTDLSKANAFSAGLADTVGVQDAIVDLVTEPDVRRTVMKGTAMAPEATGRYMWSPAREAGALVATNLPPLASGQTYEMWAVYPDHTWVSGGQFTADSSGVARLVVKPDANEQPGEADPAWFCVTIEHAGGTGENGPMILRSAPE
jgi:anti-sigma factor RsiW